MKKHESLPTNKLILVSRSGFSSAASKKAAFLKAECLSMDSALSEDWLAKMRSVIISDVQVHIMAYEVQITDILVDSAIIAPLSFYDATGREGDLVGLVRRDLVSNEDVNKAVVDRLHIQRDCSRIMFEIDISTGIFKDWYVLDAKGNRHNIRYLRFHATVERNSREIMLQHSKLGGTLFSHAFLDEQKPDLITFVKQDDGSITAAGFIAKSAPGKAQGQVLAQYYFMGEKLLARSLEPKNGKKS